MTRSSAEEELLQFTSGFKRIYKYKQEFIPDHYITIHKVVKFEADGSSTETYEIIGEESTTTIEGFDKELFIRLLMKEELKYNDSGKWFMKVKDLRTDGCNCGSWATVNPNHHAFWCNRTKWGPGNE